MGDAEVTASNWRLVEVGRVAIFAKGPNFGKLVAIVQIIDHKRVRFIPLALSLCRYRAWARKRREYH